MITSRRSLLKSAGFLSGLAGPVIVRRDSYGQRRLIRILLTEIYSDGPAQAIFSDFANRVGIETNDRIQLVIEHGPQLSAERILTLIAQNRADGTVSDPSRFSNENIAFRVIGDTVGAFDNMHQQYQWLEESALEISARIYRRLGLHPVAFMPAPRHYIMAYRRVDTVDRLSGLNLDMGNRLSRDVLTVAGVGELSNPQGRGPVERESVGYTVSDNIWPGWFERTDLFYLSRPYACPVSALCLTELQWHQLESVDRATVVSQSRRAAVRLRDLYLARQVDTTGRIRQSSIELVQWNEHNKLRFRQLTNHVVEKFAENNSEAMEIYLSILARQHEFGLI